MLPLAEKTFGNCHMLFAYRQGKLGQGKGRNPGRLKFEAKQGLAAGNPCGGGGGRGAESLRGG
jgi:hypothetical protein